MSSQKLLPLNAHHRFCLQHLASNFNKRFHDKRLKNMIMRADQHNQVRKFNIMMDSIRQYNEDPAKILDKETKIENASLLSTTLSTDERCPVLGGGPKTPYVAG
jgi:hypothetical protein